MTTKKIVFLLFAFFYFQTSDLNAQAPSTDIFLIDIKSEGGKYEFGKPFNITNKEGYDNQPYFLPDGSGLLYVSATDSTQTDVYKYSFADSSIIQVTHSPENEFSPVMLNDGKHISVIEQDENKAQHFVKINLKNQERTILLENNDSAAYYAWMNDTTVAMCVLNGKTELHIYNILYQDYYQLEVSGTGRCFVKYPNTEEICYYKKLSDSTGTIMRYSEVSGESVALCPALQGSEDFAIMPTGKVLMGSGGKLFAYFDSERKWKQVADFTETAGPFYRLVLNPKGDRLAIVAYKGKKP